MVHEFLLLGNPVGVLHQVALIEPWPVLGFEVTGEVVTAVVLHTLPIATCGEEVQRVQRVVILTLSNHVLLADVRHGVVEVERQLIVTELSRITEVEVVTVEVVVVDKTGRVGSTERQVCLVLVSTCRD